MYTQKQIDSILYQSYTALGDIGVQVSRLKNKGIHCDKLYQRGYCLRNYLKAYDLGNELTDKEKESILQCLIEVSQIRAYPASAPLIYREAPSINYGIPGPQGIQGDPGPEGPQGLQGIQGPEGPQGLQGIQGIEGPAGPTGPQGLPGIQGDEGDPGPQGPAGDPGAIGPQGPAGLDGDRFATTSSSSMTIPSTHPTSINCYVEVGLAYTVGQQIIIAYDDANYFTAQVSVYNPNTGYLAVNSLTHFGSGTYTAWQVNLEGGNGPQGKAFVVSDPDITLTASKIASVEGGSWTPQSPYVASVYYDGRSDKNSPLALSGNMDGHSIQYDGSSWYDNGIWRGPTGSLSLSEFWDGAVYTKSGSSTSARWWLRMRRGKNGYIYYHLETDRVGSGNFELTITLTSFPSNMQPARYLINGDSGISVIRVGLPVVYMSNDQINPAWGEKAAAIIFDGSNWKLSIWVVDGFKAVCSGCYATIDPFI